MAIKPNVINRKTLVVLAALILIICSCTLLFLQLTKSSKEQSMNQYPICSSDKYHSVNLGMSKAEITSLLGQPQSKRIKTSPDQNFFYQGEDEAKIKEGWIYHIDNKAGSAEIYFDSSNRFYGKNCGVG